MPGGGRWRERPPPPPGRNTDLAVVDRYLTRLLNERRLFLSPEPERTAATDAMYVCVDDGFPGGVPIGHVTPSDAGTWSAYARVRPGRIFAEDLVSGELSSLEDAVRAVLEHARYEDVMAELEEEPEAWADL